MATITFTATTMRCSDDSTFGKIETGEAINAGQLIYKKVSDSKAWLASNSSLDEAVLLGVAIQSAASGGTVAYISATAGQHYESSATPWTKGATYILADTAGSMMDAGDEGAGDYVTVVGVAVSTSKLKFINSQSGIEV